MRGAAFAALLCVCAVPAAADSGEPSRMRGGWRAARDPSLERAHHLLRQGRALAVSALRSEGVNSQSRVHQRLALESALTRLERARAVVPKDAELLTLLGRVLVALSPHRAQQSTHYDQLARSTLEAARSADPFHEADQVARGLAVLHVRAGRFMEAADEYERALQLSLDDSPNAELLRGQADALMLGGEAERAAQLYERAVEGSSGEQRSLALWGWAAALDRVGAAHSAREQVRRALLADPELNALADGAEAVPAWERAYWEGLAKRALAAPAVVGEEPVPPLSDAQLGSASERMSGELAHALKLLEGSQLGPLAQGRLASLAIRRNEASATAATPANDGKVQQLIDAIAAYVSFSSYLGAAKAPVAYIALAESHRDELAQAITRALHTRNSMHRTGSPKARRSASP